MPDLAYWESQRNKNRESALRVAEIIPIETIVKEYRRSSDGCQFCNTCLMCPFPKCRMTSDKRRSPVGNKWITQVRPC